MSAPLPENEALRLGHLRTLNIVQTPRDEKFDRITRVLCRIFDTSFAAITLIEEKTQWFKSIQGLEITHTPRDTSFCAHALLSDDSLIVPDALQDPRFANNPFVCGEPYVRFYAGHPLTVAPNIRLGALCVFDSKPRDFSLEDQQFLRDFAETTAQSLNMPLLSTLLLNQGDVK
jgi:GAF domain-containing protein